MALPGLGGYTLVHLTRRMTTLPSACCVPGGYPGAMGPHVLVKVSGLEQVSGGVKRDASFGDIPSSSQRRTPSKGLDKGMGKCEPI